jgi:hypothetical protein
MSRNYCDFDSAWTTVESCRTVKIWNKGKNAGSFSSEATSAKHQVSFADLPVTFQKTFTNATFSLTTHIGNDILLSGLVHIVAQQVCVFWRSAETLFAAVALQLASF